jgi:hypothetical protein
MVSSSAFNLHVHDAAIIHRQPKADPSTLEKVFF